MAKEEITIEQELKVRQKLEQGEYVPLKDLPLSNDFLFGETMVDPDTCKAALEIIMNRELAEVTLVNKEQHIDVDGRHKGIRLDIYVKDMEGRIYNVEMQTENRYNIPKRSRHYQSMIDIKLLPAGEIDYNKLNDTVIIFICTFDLFGKKRYIYEFESRCIQDLQLRLEDGSRKVYLYTGGTNDAEVSSELVEFLHMIEHPDNITITSPRVKKIHNRVATVKQDMQVEARYMRELIFEKELLEKGREQGREQGLIEGEEKHIREQVQKKLGKGQTVEQIADALEEDVTRIREIVAELSDGR